MARPRSLPDNSDGRWRQYHGSAYYHHYGSPSAFSNYHVQVADCGRTTRTGSGAYSRVDPTIGRYHGICGKCRRLVEAEASIPAAADPNPEPERCP